MEVRYSELMDLQTRVTLLEGGNTGVQVLVQNDISELSSKFDRLITYLEKFFNVGNISMTDIRRYVQTTATSSKPTSTTATTASANVEMDELKADVNALSNTLTETRNDINERFDRLLNYLENWVKAGSLTMTGVKEEVEH